LIVPAIPFVSRLQNRRLRWGLLIAGHLMLAVAVTAPFVILPIAAMRYLLLFGLAILLAVLGYFAPSALQQRTAYLAFLLALLAAPSLASRQLPCNEQLLAKVAAQPDVEVLFDNSTSIEIPKHRVELLCDPTTGIYLITPHSPNSRLAFIEPNGGYRSILLPGEASTKSLLVDGILYTGPKGTLYPIDVQSGEIKPGPRLMANTIALINFDSTDDLLAMVEDKSSYCHLAHFSTLGGGGALPLRLPGSCQSAGDHRVLVSELAWPGRRMTLYRLADRAVLAQTSFFDLGFNDIVIDKARKNVYASLTLSGQIRVFDLDTLSLKQTIHTPIGVRSVLLNPSGNRLYAWNYFDGFVYEHQLPDGRLLRKWRLGSNLRNLNWDCDGQSILAASCLGGFRIKLNAD